MNLSPQSNQDDFSPISQGGHRKNDPTESSFYVAGDDRTAQANFSDESEYYGEQKDLINLAADSMNPKMNIRASPSPSLKKGKVGK